jgi:hypothetical protein
MARVGIMIRNDGRFCFIDFMYFLTNLYVVTYNFYRFNTLEIRTYGRS